MYLSYYNLKRKPFQINTDPRFLWLGEKHKEALATLKYGIRDSKGFLLLTGEIGTGKTTLINALLNSLEENVIVATVSDPALNRLEFFQYVAISFGIRQEINSKVDFLMHFGRFLQEAAEREQMVLLIIDEAQRLTHELLEEIRLLSNIEKQQAKLLNVFFIGQSEFNDILQDPRNKALRQRISINYHIDTLSQYEVADYIRHRLLIAGSRKALFSPDAIHQVYLYSGGFPRLINVICDRALLTGYVEDVKQVKAKIIKECARELELPQRLGRRRKRWWPVRKRSEVKVAGKTAPGSGSSLRALVGVPALVLAAGLVVFNAGNWNERRGVQDQLGEIVADIRGGSPAEPKSRAGAAEVGAAVTSTPGTDSAPAGPGATAAGEEAPEEAASPPEVAQKLPSAGEKENGPGEQEEPPTESSGPEEVAASGAPETKAAPATSEEVLPEESLAAEEPPATASGEGEPAAPAENAARSETADDAVPVEAESEVAVAGRRPEAASPAPAAESGRAGNFMVNFDIDSNELSPSSFDELDRLAELMHGNQEMWAVVTGYTDTSGFYHYNKKISESRANMVKSYLVGRGIPPHKIQTFGKGPEDPIASNESQEGRELNRRVEIELVKGG